jgi:hypothetical protein
MASGPMPVDEDKMPIYALGLNIGMQISQQVSFYFTVSFEAGIDFNTWYIIECACTSPFTFSIRPGLTL